MIHISDQAFPFVFLGALFVLGVLLNIMERAYYLRGYEKGYQEGSRRAHIATSERIAQLNSHRK